MAGVSLDETLGASFLGTIATSCLYGITVVQTYIYYKYNSADPAYLQVLVFLLWVLDTLHLAFVVHAVYFYVVTNFTNVLNLLDPTWSILSQIVVSAVSDLAVRGVFCHRVWKLSSQNYLLTIAIAISSIIVFAGGLAFAIKGFSLHTFARFSEISDILYLSLGSGVVADVLIAGSMCFLLAKRRTGFTKTDSMVRVLMMYSINTGALTSFNVRPPSEILVLLMFSRINAARLLSLCALLTLLTYASMPNNYIFIAFYFVLPKLLLNSLLATLNARQPLRETNSGGGMVSIPLSTTTNSRLSFAGLPHFSRSHTANSAGQMSLQIQVETTTDMKTDSDPHQVIEEEDKKSWRPVYSRAENPMAFGAV